MNKKILTLILVILISFCFLSIVVANNVAYDDNHISDHNKTDHKDKIHNNTTNHDKKADNDKKIDKNKTIIDNNNNTTDKNTTENKSNKDYVLAKGNGNDIEFSDGFRGFRLNYSKSPASSGDQFKPVSASAATNSNLLKLAIIQCYRLDSTGQIGKVMADIIKNGASSANLADSDENVINQDVIKINDYIGAIFDFEVLKSVSGNESDYFAYKVSFITINDDEKQTNQTNNLTNETNTTNITNLIEPANNQTNTTYIKNNYDGFLALLFNSLFDSWKPIIETLTHDFLMIVNALEGLTMLYEEFILEFQSLMDALEKLLIMLQYEWKELEGILKLLSVLWTAIEQLLKLIQAFLNFIMALINAIIAFLQQLLAYLMALIQLLLDLINQLIAFIQAIMAFLKAIGSFLINIIENALIIICVFVIITIVAFIYNKIR